MKNFVSRSASVCLAVILCTFFASPGTVRAAEATVNLGTTASFAVLAGSTITNTGSTVISGSAGGDVGVWPGASATGFPPATVSDGSIHLGDAVAQQAQSDLTIAYDDAASRTVTQNLTDQDLGGMTLVSGVYAFDSSAQLTGTLTLDAENNPDAAFIFQIGSTLTTASNSTVNLINGAQYCRVFWQVGSSATIGTGSQFIGHIFALTSITATTGATVQGQLLARNGAVTLDTNTITNGVCAAPTPTPTPTVSPTPVPTVTPTPTVSPTPEATTTPTVSPAPTATTAPTASPTPTSDTGVTKTGEMGGVGFIGVGLLFVVGGLAIFLRRRRVNG